MSVETRSCCMQMQWRLVPGTSNGSRKEGGKLEAGSLSSGLAIVYRTWNTGVSRIALKFPGTYLMSVPSNTTSLTFNIEVKDGGHAFFGSNQINLNATSQCQHHDETEDILAVAVKSLKKQYVNILDYWTMAIITADKNFDFMEVKRENYMVDLQLHEGNDYDGKWKAINERSFHLERLLKGGSNIDVKNIMAKGSYRCVVSGVAGIGKTSLFDYMTLSWAKESMFNATDECHFELLFRFVSKDLNLYRERSITARELFLEKFKLDIDVLEQKIDGEKVLIVIDGIDEFYALGSLFDDNSDDIVKVMRNLIERDSCIFNGHYVMIAGRPYAIHELEKHRLRIGMFRKIEVIGFSEDSSRSHILKITQNDQKLAEYITKRINKSSIMQCFARIPVFLASICWVISCDEEGMNIHKTTDIYAWTFCFLLKYHFRSKKNDFVCTDLHEILELDCIREFIRIISKVAYTLLSKEEIIYDFTELESILKLDADLKHLINGFIVENGDQLRRTCTFRHLTLQEFFAAIYCFQNEISTDVLIEKKMIEVTEFYAGFQSTLSSETPNIKALIAPKHAVSPEKSLKLFSKSICKSFRKDKIDSQTLVKILFELLDANYKLPDAVDVSRTFFRLTSPLTVTLFLFVSKRMDTVVFHNSKLEIRHVKLNQIQSESVGRLVPHFTWTGIWRCRFEIELAKELSKEFLELRRTDQPPLKELRVYCCQLANNALVEFSKCLPYIDIVGLSLNVLHSDGLRLLAESCLHVIEQNPDQFRLKELWFNDCNIDDDGMKEVAKFVPFLQELKMDYNQYTQTGKDYVLQSVEQAEIDNRQIRLKEIQWSWGDVQNFEKIPTEKPSRCSIS